MIRIDTFMPVNYALKYVALNSKIQIWQQDKFFENAFKEDRRRRTKIRNIKTTVTVNRI